MDNKLKIINYLGKNFDRKFTMNQLSKILVIPYASFYRTIQKLHDILNIETIGKSKVINLKLDNNIIKSYLVLSSEEEKKEFLQKNKIIKKLASELKTKEIIILFGSYAKGKETEKSDIDILVINKEGKKTLSFLKYELLFNKKINIIFITRREFNKMILEKEENLGKQALRNHVMLNNPELFWEIVIHGIR